MKIYAAVEPSGSYDDYYERLTYYSNKQEAIRHADEKNKEIEFLNKKRRECARCVLPEQQHKKECYEEPEDDEFEDCRNYEDGRRILYKVCVVELDLLDNYVNDFCNARRR